MLKQVKQLLDQPWVNFAVAVIIIGSGLAEGWDTMAEDLQNLNIKSHHGVIVFGFVNMLQSIPDLLMGVEKVAEHKLAAE